MVKSIPYSPHVVLTGVSFRTLDVAGREKLVSSSADPGVLASRIIGEGLAREAAVISTCNRFEIVSVGAEPGRGVRRFFEDLLGLGAQSALYEYVDQKAVQHVYRVSSSLDSMVVGEAQILGQMKDAYRKAVQNGSVGSHLHHLFQSAFHVAKKVRAHTDVAQHGVSVSYVAVRLAQQIFQDLSETRVMIIGSGEMAELAALHLCSHGCRRITVANRTVERAAQLAERFGGAAIGLGEIEEMIDQIDIVIGSIRTDRALISRQVVDRRKPDTPLFLIDLGVPRNVSAEVADVDNVYLYNIDDLIGIADQNKALREAAAKEADIVIDYGLLQFERWRKKIELQPEVVNLRAQIDQVCRGEVTRLLAAASIGDLSQVAQREQLVAELSRGISGKLSHKLSKMVARYLGASDDDDDDAAPFVIVDREGGG